MKETLFYKMQGCGNDFLIVDTIRNTSVPEFSKQEIQTICDRHYGIGADGLVLLSQTTPSYSEKKTDATWRFYNCDGSEAEMCGNAARCVIRFLAERYFKEQSLISLDTKAGIIFGTPLEGDWVEISMPGPVPHDKKYQYSGLYQEVELEAAGKKYTLFCLNTGVPHAVIEVEDLSQAPVDQIGKAFVSHPHFGKAGSNITFFEKTLQSEIKTATFERGVEQVTLACGTGMVAAALVYSQLYVMRFPIKVHSPGGDTEVDLSPKGATLLLRGPAKHVMEVYFSPSPNPVVQDTFFTRRMEV